MRRTGYSHRLRRSDCAVTVHRMYPRCSRSVLQKPSQLPNLIRVARDHNIARRALQSGRKQMGIGLGFPYYNSLVFDRAFGVTTAPCSAG